MTNRKCNVMLWDEKTKARMRWQPMAHRAGLSYAQIVEQWQIDVKGWPSVLFLSMACPDKTNNAPRLTIESAKRLSITF